MASRFVCVDLIWLCIDVTYNIIFNLLPTDVCVRGHAQSPNTGPSPEVHPVLKHFLSLPLSHLWKELLKTGFIIQTNPCKQ